ncbi:MFS transporter [Aquabacter spiritensis]|uniref:Putative MFS family arabinose efflux permease n=1 Tax=Aquabacter spiritensis TaxID=933073 RepID=A0A4R3LWR3_9HYPH|nr:MFS transporter [Aquabacter spiritensis]TCT05064.1 putative MFS family arabinose efflux permease [Aquabacter spiritensis]
MSDRPPAAASDLPVSGRSLFITGLGIGQICSWGALYYSFPLIAEAMGRDLGWSKPHLFGAASLGLALGALAAFPVGAAIDKGNGRWVMAGGSILAGLALLAWSQVRDIALFYVLVAAIGVLQAATLYEPAFAVVARRTGAGAARAGITALTLWGGFASTVFVPLIQALLDGVGWRGALIALGAVNLLVCAPLYAAVIRPAADHGAAAGVGRPLAAAVTLAQVLRRVARRPAFWALALAFTAYAAVFSAFTFHLYPLLLERGFEAASVVAAMAIIGPTQVAGRVAISVFAPRASVRRIGSWVVLAFPLAIFALAWLPPSFALVAAIVALYGSANGIMTIVRGLVVPEMLTRHAYGAVNGALAAPAMLARAAAPAGAALLWAQTQSYGTVLSAMAAGCVLMACAFWAAAALSSGADDPSG